MAIFCSFRVNLYGNTIAVFLKNHCVVLSYSSLLILISESCTSTENISESIPAHWQVLTDLSAGFDLDIQEPYRGVR